MCTWMENGEKNPAMEKRNSFSILVFLNEIVPNTKIQMRYLSCSPNSIVCLHIFTTGFFLPSSYNSTYGEISCRRVALSIAHRHLGVPFQMICQVKTIFIVVLKLYFPLLLIYIFAVVVKIKINRVCGDVLP